MNSVITKVWLPLKISFMTWGTVKLFHVNLSL